MVIFRASASQTVRRGAILVRMVAVITGSFLVLLLADPAASRVAAAPVAQPPLDVAAIDRFIEQEMAATRLPGLAVAIVGPDGMLHQRGFGRADPNGTAVTPQTLFTIGSTGKTLTALAVMQLVEKGRLDLDAPVRDYLPSFDAGGSPGGEQITTRQLLSHGSGISTAAGLALAGRGERGAAAAVAWQRALQRAPLAAPPGERFEYSNANYIWLGMLIEAVSGQPYESYLREHVLEPLEMSRTALTLEEARTRGLATGHRYWFGRPVPFEMAYSQPEVPAGFIHSSVEEMAHYLIMLLNDGRYGERQLLSPAGIEAMRQAEQLVRPATPGGEAETHYGLGWFSGTLNGVPAYYHGGVTPTFRAGLVLLPEQHLALVTLINGEHALQQERITGITGGIVSLLAGKEPPPPPPATSLQLTVLRYLLGAAVIQVAGMGYAVWRLRRWQHDPARRPSPRRIRLVLLGSLLSNLLWALLTLRVAPGLLGGGLTFLRLFSPDLGTTMLVSGVAALGWALLHPILIVRVTSRPGVPDPKATPLGPQPV